MTNKPKKQHHSQANGRRNRRAGRRRGAANERAEQANPRQSKSAKARAARPAETAERIAATPQDDAARQAARVPVAGILELHPKGFGFLRDAANHCKPTATDPYVPASIVEQYGLRQGSHLNGLARHVRRGEGPMLQQLHDVDGCPPDDYTRVASFDALTPINPEAWLNLETGAEPVSTRVIDLFAPLGKGQRGLIVAPPRSGKTVLLQQIGQAIAANHPDVELMVLLVDERPEEVTDMRRNIPGHIFASNLDQEVESHVRLSRLIVDRGQRLAEQGKDVVLLVDSITRMARAFNKWTGNTGRTMTGGLDIRALDVPKQLFASARAFEEGGSLTILATALVETGSRMDDLIFEEFKGTGNMELVLDRQLADRRVWPAIDLTRSGTRREEKLLDAHTLRAVSLLRRTISTMHPVDAMQRLIAQLAKHPSNRAFLELIARQAA